MVTGDVTMVTGDVTMFSGLGDVVSVSCDWDETCCLARSRKLSTAFSVFGFT